jgi:hypothetical protein
VLRELRQLGQVTDERTCIAVAVAIILTESSGNFKWNEKLTKNFIFFTIYKILHIYIICKFCNDPCISELNDDIRPYDTCHIYVFSIYLCQIVGVFTVFLKKIIVLICQNCMPYKLRDFFSKWRSSPASTSNRCIRPLFPY